MQTPELAELEAAKPTRWRIEELWRLKEEAVCERQMEVLL